MPVDGGPQDEDGERSSLLKKVEPHEPVSSFSKKMSRYLTVLATSATVVTAVLVVVLLITKSL